MYSKEEVAGLRKQIAKSRQALKAFPEDDAMRIRVENSLDRMEQTLAEQVGVVTDCKISPMPGGICDPLPKVQVRLDGGDVWIEVFDFYPDELSFSTSEFMGKTLAECRKVKFDKDQEYLRS